jgi:hypothetical protein
MSKVDRARLKEALFTERPADEKLGKAWDNHLYEQYELYVEMMDKVSERRIAANTLFLTTNTGLVALYAVAIALLADLNIINDNSILNLLTVVVGLCGILICINWFRLIRSYSDLNTGKFEVIHQLEQRLPARLYQAEWIGLGEGKGPGYRPLTDIERAIPIIFIVIYLFVAATLLITFSQRTIPPNPPLVIQIVTATPPSVTTSPAPSATP